MLNLPRLLAGPNLLVDANQERHISPGDLAPGKKGTVGQPRPVAAVPQGGPPRSASAAGAASEFGEQPLPGRRETRRPAGWDRTGGAR